MADNETIADLIAWLRKPREGENAYLTLWRDEIADRIEAAHKRERGDAAKLREADHNWDAICEKCSEGEPPDGCRYYGEPSGCNSPMYGEHPKPFGENAAVLRSAIIEILSEMEDMAGLEVGRKYKFSPDAMVQQCRDALAAPPRNCDVGTAQEQYKRFMNMCNSKDVRQCAECSMRGFTPGCSRDRCFANWAQMPYEEGGAK